jgi:ribosomal protein S12 methylthiotransferase
VAKGVKEVMLIAQDLTYYGIDLYKKNHFAQLLSSLSGIKGLEWIRLHYTYPAGFPEEIIPIIKANTNICNYIDMPIQHINNRILALMQRGHTTEGTLDLLRKIRRELPDVALRTTFIVGFPGETDAEFTELVDFVREFEFDRVGVFTYSPEEGTTAFKLKDSVSEEEKQQRLETLMDVQQSISLKLNSAKIGKTLNTIIDRKEGGYYIGRTEFDSPEVDNEVIIDASERKLQIGRFYPVLINKVENFDLFGSVSL